MIVEKDHFDIYDLYVKGLIHNIEIWLEGAYRKVVNDRYTCCYYDKRSDLLMMRFEDFPDEVVMLPASNKYKVRFDDKIYNNKKLKKIKKIRKRK